MVWFFVLFLLRLLNLCVKCNNFTSLFCFVYLGFFPEQMNIHDLELVLAAKRGWPGKRFNDTVCLAFWLMPWHFSDFKLS